MKVAFKTHVMESYGVNPFSLFFFFNLYFINIVQLNMCLEYLQFGFELVKVW